MNPPPWNDIARQIGLLSGRAFSAQRPEAVGGGCINQSFRLSDGEQHWFVKINAKAQLAMFEAEADALAALAASRSLLVPAVLGTGISGDCSYLVLQHIELGRGDHHAWAEAGRGLAALHRHRHTAYGWHRSNSIGATAQVNDWQSDWVAFWRDNRLGWQLDLAARNGCPAELRRLGERLLQQLPLLLDHRPQPSLLHGDLWSGNLAFTHLGEATIFDPATYYGDRETDLAMTELFGGFSAAFYDAYRQAWPLPPGYDRRRTLYNLYHVLNHFNLFGGAYLAQARQMMLELIDKAGRLDEP